MASGLLEQTTVLPDGRKIFQYALDKPTAAPHIGIAVGYVGIVWWLEGNV